MTTSPIHLSDLICTTTPERGGLASSSVAKPEWLRRPIPTPEQLGVIREHADSISLRHAICEDSWYSCPLSDDGCSDDTQATCNCDQPERANLKRDIETLLVEVERLRYLYTAINPCPHCGALNLVRRQ